MKIFSSLFFSVFCYATIISQNVKVNAKAHPFYIGQEVNLVVEKNNITNTYEVLSTDTVDSLGYFHLETEIKSTALAYIKINTIKSAIYLSPDYVYGIVFPKPEGAESLINRDEETVNMSILGSDSTELNALIIDFNIAFDKYWNTHYQEFVKRTHFKSLDSFELKMQNRFKDYKTPYIMPYINYTFANLNESTGRLKKFLAKKYLIQQPFAINNTEYLKFIGSYFKNYYKSKSFSKDQSSIYDILATNKIEALDAYVQSDILLKNDTLRQWVHCKNLFDMYYNGNFNAENIRSLVLQLKEFTTIEYIKEICYDILNTTNTTKIGKLAENFILPDANDKLIALSDFKNKYIYLQFFKSNNTKGLEEIKKLQSIQKKYNNKVHFISVCLDDSLGNYKDFKKNNPAYNWTILYGGKDRKLFSDYDLKQTHQYLLLSKEHYVMRAPADMPSEGIDGFFRRLFYKDKK
jgi:peroxiredoxin